MKDFHIDNLTGRNSAGLTPNQPLQRLAATSIIGDNIFNPSGEILGKIKDLMLDITQGKVEYVVVESGGFLGMNQKYFAIPWDALSVAREHQHAFMLNEERSDWKQYPGFDKNHWPDTNAHG